MFYVQNRYMKENNIQPITLSELKKQANEIVVEANGEFYDLIEE